ncbi:MAG: hypothetical protein JWO47_489 [Candidatus Saccharibacteria bacterium]|nr:hypothetical protein [Candidatus Saccharibacteria bacterium]
MTHELPDLRNKNSNTGYKIILGVAGSAVVIGLSFLGGMQYQKGKTAKSITTVNGNVTLNGRRGGVRNGTFGSVTTVSTTSITVNDTRTNTTKTLTIDSSTVVTNSGAAAAVSDIKVGDTVIVTASAADTTKAARILLNPAQGGFQGGPGAGAPIDNSGAAVQSN